MLQKEIENRRAFFEKPERYLNKNFKIQIRKEIVEELLGTIQNKSILDIGCGNGAISKDLLLQKNQIHFVDASSPMLELAKKNIPSQYASQARFSQSTIEDFNEKEQYDIIICMGLLAHVSSVENCIQKLYTYLRSDGILLLQLTDNDKILAKLNNLIGLRSQKSFNIISFSNLKNIIDHIGLKIDRLIQYSVLMPGMGILPESWLYSIQKKSMRTGLLHRISYDKVLVLKQKSVKVTK